MSVGWNGAAPVSLLDGSDYDLGTKYHANADITITDIRIFGGDTGSMGGRQARLFNAAGGTLATVTLPNTMTPGWATFALGAPVDINTGADFWVCYDTVGSYGLVNPAGYPVASADGLVTAVGGGFNNTPALFPDTSSAAFFGVDIQYGPRAGNQRPVVGLAVDVTGPLQVQANVTITDETPASCSVVVEWGDGQTSSGTGPLSVAHTYAAAGTYAVMATVTDAGGLTDSAAVPVTVVAAFTGLDIEAIQQAMADAADTIAGLRCFSALPGSIHPPTFAPVEFELTYHGTFSPARGLTEIMFTCGVYAANSNAGRKQLLPLLAAAGVGSVPAALEADKTLGGACRQLVVQRVRGAYRLYSIGDTDYLGAMIDVKVWA